MSTDKQNPHGEKGVIEQAVDDISSTLNNFINAQLVSSLLLLVCMFLAVVICNLDSTKDYYDYLIMAPFGFNVGGLLFNTNLHDFLNDFLLPVFFFVLGLEIKREFVVGELSELSKFIYVLLCAIGGAIFPIITYLLINFSNIIIAFLASIGYTMSLFISELAFSSHELTNIAKLSIFISALVSLLIAITIMITKNRWMVLNPSWSKNKLNTESIINK